LRTEWGELAAIGAAWDAAGANVAKEAANAIPRMRPGVPASPPARHEAAVMAATHFML
jgi:hypothetical protein